MIHSLLRRGVYCLLILLLQIGSVHAGDAETIRLSFVLNFARFVEWPESVLKPEAPLRICLAPGDKALAAQWNDLTGQNALGHPVQARTVNRPNELENCHILFLPSDMPLGVAAWTSVIKPGSPLTISDQTDFVDNGGMIGLLSVAGRYRFDINLVAARQADLRISAHLLKLARTVK